MVDSGDPSTDSYVTSTALVPFSPLELAGDDAITFFSSLPRFSDGPVVHTDDTLLSV